MLRKSKVLHASNQLCSFGICSQQRVVHLYIIVSESRVLCSPAVAGCFQTSSYAASFLEVRSQAKETFAQCILSSSIYKCTFPLGEVIPRVPQTYQAMEFFLFPDRGLD